MSSPEHTPLNVLVIEDSEDDTQLLLRQLQRSHYSPEHRRVQSAAELRESLRDKSWDVIFSDHSMPNFSAPDALAVVKESGQDIPFIVVSGSIGDEQAVAVMKAGAHDYIMKDNLSRLGPIVDRELREADVRTQRLRAEATLRESEAVFRALSSSSPLGIYTADVSGRVTYANQRACEIFGIPAAEALGNTWLQRLPPEDRPKAWSNWMDYVGGGGTSDFIAEHHLQFGEGADRWIRTRVSPVRNEGTRVGYVGTIEDVTEFKTAEIALVQSEEYNRKLIQEARDIIFSIAPDATIVALNPAFVTVSGWKTEEWVGKPFLPLVHPEDVASSLANLQQVLVGEAPPPFELRILTKSGIYLDVEFTPYARTQNDRIVGVNGIARDVTQRKRLEEQLHQAQKVEAIGSLAGGIAHDFNNILSVIMGYADLALTDLDPESESHHCVNEISPRNRKDRARAWGSPPFTASSSRAAERSRSPPSPVRAAGSPSTCLASTNLDPYGKRGRRRSRICGGTKPFSSSRTRNPSGFSPSPCSEISATRSSTPRTGKRRCAWCSRSTSRFRWSSPTWSCRRWAGGNWPSSFVA